MEHVTSDWEVAGSIPPPAMYVTFDNHQLNEKVIYCYKVADNAGLHAMSTFWWIGPVLPLWLHVSSDTSFDTSWHFLYHICTPRTELTYHYLSVWFYIYKWIFLGSEVASRLFNLFPPLLIRRIIILSGSSIHLLPDVYCVRMDKLIRYY